MMDRFYVYVISLSGRPVYVGKGQGRCSREHFTDPARINAAVVAFMRKCHTDGREPMIEFERGLTEAEAFEREIELIKIYGREDNGTGILLNQTNGGAGVSGCEPRRRLDPTDRIVAGKVKPDRRAGTGRRQRYEDALRSKTVGAFLAKHPGRESTINRYVAAGWIELQPRERRNRTK